VLRKLAKPHEQSESGLNTEELNELAEQLVGKIREQGEGYLGTTVYQFRPSDNGDPEYLGSQPERRFGGFALGSEDLTEQQFSAIADDFESSSVAVQLKPNEQGLTIRSFTFVDDVQEENKLLNLIRRRRSILVDASSYAFRMPVAPTDDISRDLVLYLGVRNELSGEIDAALDRDPRLMIALFKKMYPDILATEELNIKPADAVVLMDYRERKPNETKVGARPYPERILYPQELAA